VVNSRSITLEQTIADALNEIDAGRAWSRPMPWPAPAPVVVLNRSYPSWRGKRIAPHRSVTLTAISPETVKLIVIGLTVARR
jgi:hypothetical protein